MIVWDLTGSESHPVYQQLELANGARQYDFLKSIVETSLALQRTVLTENVLRALNFQAIACLHTSAGAYRPCNVDVGTYKPPAHYLVDGLMEDFVSHVNRRWDSYDPVLLAAYVLWGLNYIHPFINGNGRTARAASYFVLCVRAGGWLPGKTILPELIKRDRAAYVAALKSVDASLGTGTLDLSPLHALLMALLIEQLASAAPAPPAAPAAPATPAPQGVIPPPQNPQNP